MTENKNKSKNTFETKHPYEFEYMNRPPLGERYRFKFPNGHSASVIRNQMSYGGDQGLWEVMTTPLRGVTDDSGVAGWLTEEKVGKILDRVAALPSEAEMEATELALFETRMLRLARGIHRRTTPAGKRAVGEALFRLHSETDLDREDTRDILGAAVDELVRA